MKTLDFVTLNNQLDELLPQAFLSLKGLYYGHPAELSRDGLVVRYMSTAGGPQWCIKALDFSGREGSGFYLPDNPLSRDELKREIFKAVQYYERPLAGGSPEFQSQIRKIWEQRVLKFYFKD